MKKKLEWLSYHVEDIFIHFGLTHERDGQTDRRTDGQTDGQTPGDSKDRAYASHRAVKIRVQCRVLPPGEYG